jgi:Putative esterase
VRRVEGGPGPPWDRPLRGRLDKLVVESEVLRDNPLGDPCRRPLWVYVPAATERDSGRRLCSIYVIQGYTGQLDMWFNRSWLEPNMLERIDELFSTQEAPPAIIVFVDAWTSYGGSQFLNSSGNGRYMDYLCDEIVPFVDDSYPTIGDSAHRGLSGKSSGGYGAMAVPMLRPDVFGGLASHAGDALFEMCYLQAAPDIVRVLRDKFDGSYEVFFDRLNNAERFDADLFGGPLEFYGYAASYSPDEAQPGKAIIPFEIDTGRLRDDVWDRWLAWDPVRMAPARADALAGMKRIYLDAGKSDEFYLDLGAQAFSKELAQLGVDHTLELFDGKHGGLQYRYPRALAELARALTG